MCLVLEKMQIRAVQSSAKYAPSLHLQCNWEQTLHLKNFTASAYFIPILGFTDIKHRKCMLSQEQLPMFLLVNQRINSLLRQLCISRIHNKVRNTVDGKYVHMETTKTNSFTAV